MTFDASATRRAFPELPTTTVADLLRPPPMEAAKRLA
jgi:hypothetical protein